MVKKWKCTVLSVGLGLLLSLLITTSLFTTSQLARKGINAPASQYLLYYLLLALLNGGIFLCKRKPLKVKAIKLYYYIMLALVDVSINFFVIEAIQHTSLTSFVLLENWTIPCGFLLGWLFLKEKYGVKILIGIVICVASDAIVFISDVYSGDQGIRRSSVIKGDMFVIAGATLSGVSMACRDFLKKNDDRVTYNAFLAIFGTILTALQIVISERGEFRFILSSNEAIFLIIGFSLSEFFLCVGIHFFHKIDGSAMLDLPILITYHIWIILIRIFAYHENVDLIYFVAVAISTLGIALTVFPGRNKIDPNNVKPPINEEVDLGHSENIRISNKDGQC